jgi:hypothetical protein
VSQMLGSLMAEEQKDGWLMDYDRLLKMQERESRSMAALARGMRMTQQSTYTQRKSKGTAIKKPHQM